MAVGGSPVFASAFPWAAASAFPRVAYRRPVRQNGFFSRLFSSYHGRQCGKFPGPALLIEEIDFLQDGSWR